MISSETCSYQHEALLGFCSSQWIFNEFYKLLSVSGDSLKLWWGCYSCRKLILHFIIEILSSLVWSFIKIVEMSNESRAKLWPFKCLGFRRISGNYCGNHLPKRIKIIATCGRDKKKWLKFSRDERITIFSSMKRSKCHSNQLSPLSTFKRFPLAFYFADYSVKSLSRRVSIDAWFQTCIKKNPFKARNKFSLQLCKRHAVSRCIDCLR